uniref:Uncharacterized protein n=1 Tax=Anguilla anguilla TaxID=7936 RepID=A0A0E9VYN3_ANGAN
MPLWVCSNALSDCEFPQGTP